MSMNDEDVFNSFVDEEQEQAEQTHDNESVYDDLDNTQEQSVDDDDYENNQDTQEDLTPQESLLSKILESKGINYNEIYFENESGEEEIRKFGDLSQEEQLELISYNSGNDLDESEISIINQMRENELTFDQLVDYYKQEGVKEYLSSNVSTDIDGIDNDTLYASELKLLNPNLTDEQIIKRLDLMKSDEDLFNEEVDNIRTKYKDLEKNRLEQEEAELKDQEQKILEQNKLLVTNAANRISDIGGFAVEQDQIEDIVNYIYNPKIDGQTLFSRDLSDPEKTFKIAYLAKYSDQIFAEIHNIYESKLKELSKKPPVNTSNSNSPTKKTGQQKLVRKKSEAEDFFDRLK